MTSLHSLDWIEILEHLASKATSQLAKDELRQLEPLPSIEAARTSVSEIQAAQEIFNQGRRPFMESLDLYSVWYQRLSKDATLQPLELKDVRHFCLEVLALKELVKEQRSDWAQNVFNGLMEAVEPLSAIDQIMSNDGQIRSDASETLFKLFNEKNQLVKQTQNVLDRLIRQHEMEPVLQDRYVTNREGRWVLPVRSGRQHSFEGIIHASSASKQTVFMEPKEIIPLNNRLRQVEVDIEEEIERLLCSLSEYLARQLIGFATSKKWLFEADVRLAQAQISSQLQANPCEFTDEVHLIDLKHPLLLLKNVNVVPNTVDLTDDRRLLLLSGPNAGGKTVLLKSVGLAAHMARCGLPVAAEAGSKLPFFERIHVAVGDSQSVDQHLSTFAAHMKILNEATQATGTKTLLLIDEICGSTDPEEGTALARSFIRTFAKQGSYGVITSHLGPLKLGWQPDSGVVNGSLEYDSKSGQPTFIFLMGVPGQSLALQTARRAGVQPQIIDEAMKLLSPEAKQYHLGLADVEAMKEELHRLKEQLTRETQAAQRERKRYTSLNEKFTIEREKMVETSVKRAEKKIDTLIKHSKVDDVFRRHERLEQIKREMPQVVKASKPPAPPTGPETAEDFARVYPPGSKVFALTIGRDAVVQGTPNGKGEVSILSQSMRLTVPWHDLKPPNQAVNPTNDLVRRVSNTHSEIDQDRQIDLRGKNVEEALRQLEQQLDTAMLNQETRIKVVHGHGTEALKKGIRGYLSRSVYVKKWKAGTPETGGDGLTWVELRD